MKKIVILICCCFFFFSCEVEENLVYYSYGEVTVTRLNKGNEIYFYYGEYKDVDSLPNELIKASSFDGYIQGYLIFRETGQVEVVKLLGEIEEVNHDRSKFKLVEFDHNIDYVNWKNRIDGNFKNIVQFEDLQKFEIEKNIQNNSEVKITW